MLKLSKLNINEANKKRRKSMELQFRNDTFKILQIADTQEGRKVSPDTINLINAALDREEPDLVVYSGDQIWGKGFRGNTTEVERVLRELTKPVTDRGIPFAVCFGNHDRQVGIDNEAQFEIYKKIPGFIGESAPETDGVGNCVIEIKDGEKPVFLLYLIDSHSSLKIGYDNVHQNQIDWYRKTRDGYEEKYGHVIPSIVIQHIPVCEVFELLLQVKKSTKGSVQGFRTHAKEWFVLNPKRVNKEGFMKESPADPQENSGEFAAFKEKGDVVGLYFGHDHNNSFNGDIDGIDVGYTQGAGFHVYGPGLDRGVRSIVLKKDGTFSTYDLRFRNLVGKKLAEPLHYALFQIMPTNVYDAVSRAIKFFIGLAVVAVIVIILLFFFG